MKGFGSPIEVYQKMWGDLTWTCHICGDERPDRFIGVHTRDVSTDFNLPPGTVQENVRYCIDRDNCVQRATHYRLIKSEDSRHD